MGILMNRNYIQEIACGDNFGYILNENIGLAGTDYRILQSQGKEIFIPCMKMLYNGKTELYYAVERYKSLGAMFWGMTSDTLLTIVVNLLANIIEIDDIGFLSCQNIELSWDRIYVDEKTLKVRLIYLPVNQKNFESYSAFENELRSELIKKISEIIAVPNEKLNAFLEDIRNGSMTLKDIYRRSSGFGGKTAGEGRSEEVRMEDGNTPGVLYMTALNAPKAFEIRIERDEILIGTKAELVDVVISFNGRISRKHCKVTRKGSVFNVTDVGSSNGTYVNGKRLMVNIPCQLHAGDNLRLANTEFRIEIKKI